MRNNNRLLSGQFLNKVSDGMNVSILVANCARPAHDQAPSVRVLLSVLFKAVACLTDKAGKMIKVRSESRPLCVSNSPIDRRQFTDAQLPNATKLGELQHAVVGKELDWPANLVTHRHVVSVAELRNAYSACVVVHKRYALRVRAKRCPGQRQDLGARAANALRCRSPRVLRAVMHLVKHGKESLPMHLPCADRVHHVDHLAVGHHDAVV